MTHVKALNGGQSGQGTFEPITPALHLQTHHARNLVSASVFYPRLAMGMYPIMVGTILNGCVPN